MDVDMPSVSTAVNTATSTVSQPADLKSTKEIETHAATKVPGTYVIKHENTFFAINKQK